MQSLFEVLLESGIPTKSPRGKKPFRRGDLICYTSTAEVRRKLKFGEVSL